MFISVSDRDKRFVANVAREFQELGFQTIATLGTSKVLRESGVETGTVYKVNEGRPNVVDLIKSQKIDLIVNTPLGQESFFDEKAIRRAATRYGTPCITTLSAAAAAVNAIRALQREKIHVKSLQEYHEQDT